MSRNNLLRIHIFVLDLPTVGSGRDKAQRIVIFYRFIGEFWFQNDDAYELSVDPQKDKVVHYSVVSSSETA